MEIIKGYCSHCRHRDERDRIFDIPSDAHDVYCPYCGRRYTPKEAHDNYLSYIKKLIFDANKFYIDKGDYLKAYKKFGLAIAFESNCIEGRLGRLLSLICLSTVRRCRFNEVRELIIDDKKDYLSSPHVTDIYLFFAQNANNAIHSYVHKLKHRLCFNRKYFYEPDCLSIWFGVLQEDIKLRNEILDVLKIHYSIKKEAKIKATITSYENAIKNLEGLLESTFYTVDGTGYKFSKMYAGKAALSKQKESINVRYIPSQLATLNTLDKTKIPISNKVFSSFSFNYYLSYIAPISAVICALIAIGNIIPFFFVKSQTPLWTALLILSITFFVLSVISVVLIVVSRGALKVRKKRLFA